MENTKTKGIMTALKGRNGLESKKGVSLLGIVQKLTKKRESMGENTSGTEKVESSVKEKEEAGKS